MVRPTSTWKEVERRVAAFFGLVRVPLSGSNSGHQTRFDAMRKDGTPADVALEVKHRKRFPKRRDDYRELAQREGKPMILAEHSHGERGFWITVHSSDFKEVARFFLDNSGGTGVDE
jgi:hypothetical protein